MNSKVAIITGTSSGTGLSAAIALARAGFVVVATMRDTSKAGPLQDRAAKEGVALEVRELDTASTASVNTAIEDVLARHARIDVLVNNAGAPHVGTTEEISIAEAEGTMNVNYLGVVRATKAVLPSMRTARTGRIISVTSVGGIVGQPFNDVYCASKFAVEGHMESLKTVVGPGIHLSLVEPGPIKTEFTARALATFGERLEATKRGPYGAALGAYMQVVQERYADIGQSADDIAKIIVHAATVENPEFRYPTSDFVKEAVAQKYADLNLPFDPRPVER